MKLPESVDDRLAEHLKQAEHHLIAAVELFSRTKKPKRESKYQTRLISAQEIVTVLYREELVRIRGNQRPPRVRKVSK